MKTKRKVEAWCEANGITLDTYKAPRSGVWHVHVDINAPRKCFRAHDLHNLGLWDGEAAPDWKQIAAELIEADFGPCEIPECEYCADD